jgi:anti-sigma B factor antagonist
MSDFRLDTVGPIGDCAVLQVAGEVDAYTAPMLRERIRDLGAKDVVHLVADLSAVDFLDSTGLGALVGGLKRLREAGGSLALVITAPRILRLFQITGLTKVLAIHPTVAEAIAAWPEDRAQDFLDL